MRAWFVCALAALVLAAVPSAEAKIATLSIDLGSEWIKIGIVKPGVPMDIVLNRESKRKTANVVAIRDGERTFGADALATAIKYPKTGFRFLPELLGQQVDSPIVERYRSLFPEHTIEPDPVRNTVVFRLDDGSAYSVEELVAMMLQHVVELGAEYAEQPITSAVIVVPPFFAQPERHALLMAAELANVQVSRLVNSPVAAGLNYGVFRRTEFNSTAQHFLLYDMGSSSTVASVVGFSTVKDKETKKKTPQLELKGIGFDRTLGGFELDVRLRDHLLQEFKKAKASQLQGDPAASPRALAKLLKEAQKVKTVLSANTETFAQVEGVFEDLDFRAQVTRETLEGLADDVFARVTRPATAALQAANMTMADIRSLIVIGGSVRIPKVQEALLSTTGGTELGKNLNGDEAFALGAAYEAAALSKAFRVKKFLTRDSNVYPIEVHYNRTVETDSGESSTKTVVRAIFPHKNPIPQKKILTLNRYTDDFSFSVNYGPLDFLNADQAKLFGSLNITTVSVRGVAAVFEEHADSTPKGIKVHFRLDDSGVFAIDKIEANFETIVEEEVVVEETEGEGEQEKQEQEQEKAEDQTDEKKAERADDEASEDQNGEKQEGQEDAQNKEQGEDTTQGSQSATDDDGKETQEEAAGEDAPSSGEPKDDAGEDEEEAAKKQKKVKKTKKVKKPKTVRVPLEYLAERHDLTAPDDDAMHAATLKLAAFKEAERQRRMDEEARNELESFIFATKEQLWEDDVIECSTEEEREALGEALSEMSDWLDFEADDANATVYNAKLKALNATAKDMFYRVREMHNRPAAEEQLRESINRTRVFVETVRAFNANATEDTPEWVTEKELTELEELTNSTSQWYAKKAEEQKDLKPHENPVLKVSALTSKAKKLDRELYYLFKRPKPKPKSKSKSKAKKSKDAKEDAEMGGDEGEETASESDATSSSETGEEAPSDDKEEQQDQEATDDEQTKASQEQEAEEKATDNEMKKDEL